MEYLFGDQYTFSRPFVAKAHTEIGTVKNIIQEMITNTDETDISDIRAFARDHHLHIPNLLDLINSCNGTHLLVDDQKVISIDLTGIDEQVAGQVETLMVEELEGEETTLIASLHCIAQFPSIQIQWNDWLIYSVIKKWGRNLEVGTSSNQFKNAVPLISIKGHMDESQFSDVTREHIGEVALPDDLSNIDELLMDFSEEDWGDQL